MITLRGYQQESVDRARDSQGYALFLEQRTGKTFTALELCRSWNSSKTLVVCPKKAIPVWGKAIQDMRMSLDNFTIVNFEQLLIQKHLLEGEWDLTIIDESHRIKARGSQQTKACWKIGSNSKRRLILTGTPQGQGMEDYFSQLKFIRPDLFPTWGDFSRRYLIIEMKQIPGRENTFPKIIGYKNQDEFQRILGELSHRVTRDEVSKVKTLVRNVKLSITPSVETLSHYESLEKDLFTVIDGQDITAPMALSKALKLHQFCGGFVKDDEGNVQVVGTEKLDALKELLEGELKGQTLVVVAQYRAEMDAIANYLESRGITHTQIRGGHSYDPNDRSQVTILNPAAGEAINLAHASTMVIYSMSYSYLKWSQFKDRIVLVDTPSVKYYYLIMEGLMDQTVYEVVQRKKRLSEEVLRTLVKKKVSK